MAGPGYAGEDTCLGWLGGRQGEGSLTLYKL